MTPMLTVMADRAGRAGRARVAADHRDARRDRAAGPADHGGQAQPVPGADPRRAHRRRDRGREPHGRHHVVHHRLRYDGRRRRRADRARGDVRQAARRLRRRRPGRRHDRRPGLGPGAAVGDGRGRRDHRAADVLRDRPGPADAGDLPGRPARAGLADHRRHPGAGGAVGDARLRAAAPRPGHRDRAAGRRPRRHPRARHPGRDPDDHRRRAALRHARRALGGARRADHLRLRRRARAGRRGPPAVVRGHDRHDPAAGRADAGQGARRHRHRRPRGPGPAGLRRGRRAVHRAADRRPGGDVDLRRRASAWTRPSSRRR